jgi:hypothetical protein
MLCARCQSAVHLACAQEHLLNTIREAHCPNCLQPWSLEFLAQYLPATWRLHTYKDHRENILLERERALLPEAQEEAARQNHLVELTEERKEILAEIRRQTRSHRHATSDLEHSQISAKIVELRTSHELLIPEKSTAIIKKAAVIGPCPQSHCHGFLSSEWTCEMCHTKVCSECGEICRASHRCNVQIRDSFRLIVKDSKRCPNCGVPITKISGCDHMFCTDCKVAFSWRTMEIHKDGNSNPHYWEWRRQHPQPVVVTTCLPAAERLHQISQTMIEQQVYQYGEKFMESLEHLINFEIPRFRSEINPHLFFNLRVEFLRGKITESKWKIQIQKVDKNQRRYRALVDILTLFTEGSMDILRHCFGLTEILSTRTAIEELQKLCIDELNKIEVVYGPASIGFSGRMLPSMK